MEINKYFLRKINLILIYASIKNLIKHILVSNTNSLKFKTEVLIISAPIITIQSTSLTLLKEKSEGVKTASEKDYGVVF